MALADAIAGQRLLAMQPTADSAAGLAARHGLSCVLLGGPARGGGVLRDLSHELDYLLLLGGSWRRVAGAGGRIGPLDIRSDDYWSLLLELDGCSRSLSSSTIWIAPDDAKLLSTPRTIPSVLTSFAGP